MTFPEFTELHTADLQLRRIRMEDVPLYYERIGSREAVTRYMLFDPHRDISESVASVEKSIRRYQAGQCYRWAIALKTDDSIIGVIELLRFDRETNSCSFAYMISDAFWGRGYGTQALKAVLGFAFEQMDLSFVEVDHMVGNEASGAVMRKAGMIFLRTEEGKYRKNGAVFDAQVYRMDAEQWKIGNS